MRDHITKHQVLNGLDARTSGSGAAASYTALLTELRDKTAEIAAALNERQDVEGFRAVYDDGLHDIRCCTNMAASQLNRAVAASKMTPPREMPHYRGAV